MFPSLDLDTVIQDIDKTRNIQDEQGVAYLYDFDKGDFVTKNGRLIEVDSKEAVKVWIEKILRTKKDKYEIYKNTNYGTNIYEWRGKKVPRLLLQSELKREIEETMQQNVDIDYIKNFKIEQQETIICISFTVVLKNDDEIKQEVTI